MSDETEALETPQVEQAEEKPVTEARVASSEPTTPDTVHVSVLAEEEVCSSSTTYEAELNAD